MSNIFIAGCGKIGTQLGIELLAAGHRVWGLRRTRMDDDSGIQWIQADLTNPASLTQLPSDIDFLYYTAAASEYTINAYIQAYTTGVENLQRAWRANPPRHVMFVSSTAVYDYADGRWVNEDSPTQPKQSVLHGERAWHWPVTAIRSAGIYGPGRQQFLESVRLRKAALSAEPVYTNRIHSDDLVGFLKHLLTVPKRHTHYVACDNEPALKNTVITWLAQKLGVAAPIGLSPEQEPQRGNKRCSNQRLRESGYILKYPTFREGYAAILGEKLGEPL